MRVPKALLNGWVLSCLQAKVHAELDHVVGRGNQPRLEHSGDLHYINAFLTETLRKAAVAPSGLPHHVTGDASQAMPPFLKNSILCVFSFFASSSTAGNTILLFPS